MKIEVPDDIGEEVINQMVKEGAAIDVLALFFYAFESYCHENDYNLISKLIEYYDDDIVNNLFEFIIAAVNKAKEEQNEDPPS